MKKIIALLLAAVMVLLLTACGGGSKEIKLEDLAGELTATSAFTMDMNQYTLDASLAPQIFQYDASKVSECIYYSNNATGEEILLVKAADKDTASEIAGLCQTRVGNQKATLEMYAPDAIPRLDSAIISVKDAYVIFVVANDAAAAQAVVDKYIK